MFWAGSITRVDDNIPSQPPRVPVSVMSRQKNLEQEVRRLALMNQALWEVLRQRLGLTDEDLLRKVKEVDLRDGVEDGRMTEVGLECPTCGRVSSSKHWRCLYCGHQFERPIMG